MDKIFQPFFVSDVTELTLLHGHHHLPLMALSMLIAIAASYFALHLVR